MQVEDAYIDLSIEITWQSGMYINETRLVQQGG